ncbi:MAG: hypothetical protein HOP37_10690 [Cyclobacteriaceae bacterium]|nr:hypothetical protein [Cyclobacteriaceae bacterium]
MTSEKLIDIVERDQWFERWFGFLLFSIPLLFSLFFLGYFVLGYIRGSDILILVWFSLVVTLLCAGFAWLGIRGIQSKYRKFIVIQFNPSQVNESELINLIMDGLDYGKVKNDLALLKFVSQGQMDNVLYVTNNSNEIYVNLQTESFLSWGQKKLKKRFVDKIKSVGQANQYTLTIEDRVE